MFHDSEASDELSRCIEVDADEDDTTEAADSGGDEQEVEGEEEKEEETTEQEEEDKPAVPLPPQEEDEDDSIDEIFSTSEQLTKEGDQKFPDANGEEEEKPERTSPHDEEGDLNSGGRPEGSGDARKKYVKSQEEVKVQGSKEKLKKTKYNVNDVTISGFIKDGVSKLFASQPPGEKRAAKPGKAQPNGGKAPEQRAPPPPTPAQAPSMKQKKVEAVTPDRPKFDKKHREVDAVKITTLLRDGVARLVDEIRMLDTGGNTKAAEAQHHHHSHTEDVTIEEAIQGLYNTLFAKEVETPEEEEEEDIEVLEAEEDVTVPPPTSPPPPPTPESKPKRKKDKYNENDVTIKDAVRGMLSKLFGKSDDKPQAKKHTDEIKQMQKEKAKLINALKEQHSKMVQKKRDAKQFGQDDVTIKGFVSNLLSAVFKTGPNGNKVPATKQQQLKKKLPESKAHVVDKKVFKPIKATPEKKVEQHEPEKKELKQEIQQEKPQFKDMKKFSREAYAEDHVTIGGFVKGLFSSMLSGEKKDDVVTEEKIPKEKPSKVDTKATKKETHPPPEKPKFKDMTKFSREAYAEDHVTIGGMIKDLFSSIFPSDSKVAAKEGKAKEGVKAKFVKAKFEGKKASPDSSPEEDKSRFKDMKQFTRDAYQKDSATIGGLIKDLIANILPSAGRPEKHDKPKEVKQTFSKKVKPDTTESKPEIETKPVKKLPKSEPREEPRYKDMTKFTREAYSEDHFTFGGLIKDLFAKISGESKDTKVKPKQVDKHPVGKEVKTPKPEIRRASQVKEAPPKPQVFKDMKQFSRKAYAEDHFTFGGLFKDMFSSLSSTGGKETAKEKDKEKIAVPHKDVQKEPQIQKESEVDEDRIIQDEAKKKDDVKHEFKDMKAFSREAYAKDQVTIKSLISGLFSAGAPPEPSSEEPKPKKGKTVKCLSPEKETPVIEKKHREVPVAEKKQFKDTKQFSREAYSEDHVTISGFVKNAFSSVFSSPSEDKPHQEKEVDVKIETKKTPAKKELRPDVDKSESQQPEQPKFKDMKRFSREAYKEDHATIGGLVKNAFSSVFGSDGTKPDKQDKKQKKDDDEADIAAEKSKPVERVAETPEPSPTQFKDMKQFTREAYKKDHVSISGFVKSLFASTTPKDETTKPVTGEDLKSDETDDVEITVEEEDDVETLETAIPEDDEVDEVPIEEVEEEESDIDILAASVPDDDEEEVVEEEEEDTGDILGGDVEAPADVEEESSEDIDILDDSVDAEVEVEVSDTGDDAADTQDEDESVHEDEESVQEEPDADIDVLLSEPSSEEDEEETDSTAPEEEDQAEDSDSEKAEDDISVLEEADEKESEDDEDASAQEEEDDVSVLEEPDEKESEEDKDADSREDEDADEEESEEKGEDDAEADDGDEPDASIIDEAEEEIKETPKPDDAKKTPRPKKTKYNKDDVTIKDAVKGLFGKIFGSSTEEKEPQSAEIPETIVKAEIKEDSATSKKLRKTKFNKDDVTIKGAVKGLFIMVFGGQPESQEEKPEEYHYDYRVKVEERDEPADFKPSYMSPISATQYRRMKSKYNEDDVTIRGAVAALWQGLFGPSKPSKQPPPVRIQESKKTNVLRKTVFNKNDVTIKGLIGGMFRKIFGGKPPHDHNDYTYDYGTGKMKDILKEMSDDDKDDNVDDDDEPKESVQREESSEKKKGFLRKTIFNKDDVTIKGAVKSLFRKIFGGKSDDDDYDHSDYDYGSGAYKRHKERKKEKKKEKKEHDRKEEKMEIQQQKVSKKKSVLRKTIFNKNDVTIGGAVKSLFRMIFGGKAPVEEKNDDDDYEYNYRFEVKDDAKDSSDGEKKDDVHPTEKKKFQKHTKYNKHDVTIKGAVKGVFGYIFGTSGKESDGGDDDEDDDDDDKKKHIDDGDGGKEKADAKEAKKRRKLKTKYNENDVTIKDAVKGLFRTLFGGASGEQEKAVKSDQKAKDEEDDDDEKKPSKKSKKSKKKKEQDADASESDGDKKEEKSAEKPKRPLKTKYNKDDVTISGAIKSFFMGSKPAPKDVDHEEEEKEEVKQGTKAEKKDQKTDHSDKEDSDAERADVKKAAKLKKTKYNAEDVTISGAIKSLFVGSKPAPKEIDEGDDRKPSHKKDAKQTKKKTEPKKLVKSKEGLADGKQKKVTAEEIQRYHENDIKISTMIVDGVKSIFGQKSEQKHESDKKKEDLDDGISEREKDSGPAESDTKADAKGTRPKQADKKKVYKVDKKKVTKKAQSVTPKAGPKVVPVKKIIPVKKSVKAVPPVKKPQKQLKVSRDEDDIDKIFADSYKAEQIFKLKEKKRLEEEAKKGPTGGRAIDDRQKGKDDDDDDDWDWNENFEFVENIVKRFLRFFHSFKFRWKPQGIS